MMNRAGELTAKGFSLISRVWKITSVGTVLSFIFAAATYAAVGDNVKSLHFTVNQNNYYNFSYDIAKQAMSETYKNSAYDTNPVISIAEEDLNGDRMPEIISYPNEEYPEQMGEYCTQNYYCPHYVLQVREKSVKTLAVIFADSIDLGDNIQNGYRTLKVFKKERQNSSEYETYAYDKKKDMYVRVEKSAPHLKTNK